LTHERGNNIRKEEELEILGALQRADVSEGIKNICDKCKILKIIDGRTYEIFHMCRGARQGIVLSLLLLLLMVMVEVARRVTEGQKWISSRYAIDAWELRKSTSGTKLQSSYSAVILENDEFR
jgi:hypothetical protein